MGEAQSPEEQQAPFSLVDHSLNPKSIKSESMDLTQPQSPHL